MALLCSIKARCTIHTAVLAECGHPHALLLLSNDTLNETKLSLQTCTAGALRYYFDLHKSENEMSVSDAILLWKAGKRLNDQVVCVWAENRISGFKLLELNWGRVKRLSREYNQEEEEEVTNDANSNLLTITNDTDMIKRDVLKRINSAKKDFELSMASVKKNNDIDEALTVLNAL